MTMGALKNLRTSAFIFAACCAAACSSTSEPEEGYWIGVEGGTITYKSLTLVVPPGAVDTRTLFEVESATGLKPSSGRELLDSYKLEPSGLTFHKPLGATLVRKGAPEGSSLFLSSTGKQWEELEDSSFSTKTGKATGSIPHFSYLSLQTVVDEGGTGGTSSSGGSAAASGGAAPSATGGLQNMGGERSSSGGTFFGEGGAWYGGATSYGGATGYGGEGGTYGGYGDPDPVDEGPIRDVQNGPASGAIWANQIVTRAYESVVGISLTDSGEAYLAIEGEGENRSWKFDTSGRLVSEQKFPDAPAEFTQSSDDDFAVFNDGSAILYGNTWGSLDGHTNAGEDDFYVIRYTAEGRVAWSDQRGTSGTDQVWTPGVALDESGNLYVTGATTGSLDGEPKTNQNSQPFLVKYNASGQRVWTRILDAYYGVGERIALSEAGEIVVGGSGWLNGATEDGIFVFKYDSSGNRLWANGIGTSGSDRFGDVDFDDDGNVLLAGVVDGLPFDGGGDYALAKFSPSGDLLWNKRGVSSEAQVNIADIALDSEGSTYMVGTASAGFDRETMASEGYEEYDAFLIKYDNAGDWQWTHFVGTVEDEFGRALALDNEDSLLLGIDTDGNLAIGTEADYARSDVALLKYERSALEAP